MSDQITRGRAQINAIYGNLSRADINSQYIGFTGNELQYVIDNEVQSFCYLNINNFESFKEGMFKIDNDNKDSIIRNQNDEIIYTKTIAKIPLKSLNFTNFGNNVFISDNIPNIKSITDVLVDFYTVISSGEVLANRQAQRIGNTIQIKDEDEEWFNRYREIGYLYYVLDTSIIRKISPNPDLNFDVDVEGGSLVIVPFTETSAEADLVIDYGNTQNIKYATQKDIEFVYEHLSNDIDEIHDNYVRSVNEITPIDGDVTISHVKTSDLASNLYSNDVFTQNASFLFRTSGGDDNITTGEAYLKSVKGQAEIGEEIPASIIVEDNSPDGILGLTVNINKFTEFLTTATGIVQLNDNYTFTFNTDSGKWVLTTENNPLINNTEYSVNELNTAGIEYTYGGVIDDGTDFVITYTAEQYSSYKSTKLVSFRSIGYNLYNSNLHYAHVTKEDKLRFIFTNQHHFYFLANLTDSRGEVITFEDYQIGLTKVHNTYSPPDEGYIVIDTDDTNDDDIMINLIWSGKRIDDDEVQPYKEFYLYFNNDVEHSATTDPLELNFVNGFSDELDLEEKKLYQRVGKFPATVTNIFIVSAGGIFINDGNNIYLDFNSLNDTIYERRAQKYPNPDDPSCPVFPEQGSTVIEKSINWLDYEYEVDDFGLEEFTYKDCVPPEVTVLYKANLIDKLRRSVVTYSLQADVGPSEQANAQQNLGLISVDCYVGERTIEVIATDNAGVKLSTVSSPETKMASFLLPHLGSWDFITTINNLRTKETLEIDYFGQYNVRLSGKQYGFRRSKSISDSEARISYIYDAEGFVPVSYSNDTGSYVFDPGSWGDFIDEVAAPVLLATNGSVEYLDKNDQHKDIEGNDINWDSIIANHNKQGMVEFRKYIYVKRYEDAYYNYVIFSDEKLDSGFINQAGISVYEGQTNFEPKEKFYWGMFEGSQCLDATDQLIKIQSLPTRAFATAGTYVAYESQANNIAKMTINIDGTEYIKSRWHIGQLNMWNYICDLLTLLGKNDNIQNIFGNGRLCNGSNEWTAAEYANLTNPGFIYSYLDGTNYTMLRVFWIYNFYGNTNEPLLGLFRKNTTTSNSWANSRLYIKMFLDNTDNKYGYLPTIASNSSSAVTNAGFILVPNNAYMGAAGYAAKVTTNDLGTVPISTTTTGGQYLSDWQAVASTSRKSWIPLFGGAATASASIEQNGPRALNFVDYATSLSTTTRTPRLTYV